MEVPNGIWEQVSSNIATTTVAKTALFSKLALLKYAILTLAISSTIVYFAYQYFTKEELQTTQIESKLQSNSPKENTQSPITESNIISHIESVNTKNSDLNIDKQNAKNSLKASDTVNIPDNKETIANTNNGEKEINKNYETPKVKENTANNTNNICESFKIKTTYKIISEAQVQLEMNAQYLKNSFWLIDNNQFYAENNSIIHQFANKGSHTIKYFGTSDIGCKDSGKIIVELKEQKQSNDLTIYNTITPSKIDGINDEYLIDSHGKEFESFNLIIFDYKGNMIFQSNDNNIKWNGKQANKQLVTGQFYMKLKYKLKGGFNKEIKEIIYVY